MCLYPRLIKNRKYIANKKNGGNIPAVSDNRVLMVPIGCGKCIECKKQKTREWTVRLNEEIKHDIRGKFITLTFKDESIKKLDCDIANTITGYDRDNELAKLGVRRFLERWRKEHKKSVKHWFVTELGGNGTENIHLHGIIWTDKTNENIAKHWKYGSITIGRRKYIYDEEKKEVKQINNLDTGYVNERTINYIVKYVNKIDEKHKEYNSKILTSSGIGKKYIERTDSKKNHFKGKETNETYRTRQGIKLALPIYYRNKIYNEEEREKLWLQKLDEEKRYVCGVEIDISKGEENYYKALEWYREKNKRLGYGDNAKNWDLKRYENERRNLKRLERIKRAEKKENIKIEPKQEEEKIILGKIEDAF